MGLCRSRFHRAYRHTDHPRESSHRSASIRRTPHSPPGWSRCTSCHRRCTVRPSCTGTTGRSPRWMSRHTRRPSACIAPQCGKPRSWRSRRARRQGRSASVQRSGLPCSSARWARIARRQRRIGRSTSGRPARAPTQSEERPAAALVAQEAAAHTHRRRRTQPRCSPAPPTRAHPCALHGTSLAGRKDHPPSLRQPTHSAVVSS